MNRVLRQRSRVSRQVVAWLAAAVTPPSGRRAATAVAVATLCIGPGCDAAESSPGIQESQVHTAPVDRGQQMLYVPAYTYATPAGGRTIKLATTLTIHNVSASRQVTLRSVEYHDSPGKRVKSYIASPQVLEPLQTAEFLVNEPDTEPGAGANFIVSFDVDDGVPQPLVEAVMVGNTGTGWLSFTSRGVPVDP